jgi:hypothetical protein
MRKMGILVFFSRNPFSKGFLWIVENFPEPCVFPVKFMHNSCAIPAFQRSSHFVE